MNTITLTDAQRQYLIDTLKLINEECAEDGDTESISMDNEILAALGADMR